MGKKNSSKKSSQVRTSERSNKGVPPKRFHEYELDDTPVPLANSTAVKGKRHQSDPDLTLSEDENATVINKSKPAAVIPDVVTIMQECMEKMTMNMKAHVDTAIEDHLRAIDEKLSKNLQQDNSKFTKGSPLNVQAQEFKAPPYFTVNAEVHADNGFQCKCVKCASNAVMPENNQQSSFRQYDQRRKLHDLPVFGGEPEQWPLFMTSFEESTKAFNYSPLENLMRLQKCIQGKAKNAVEAMLIHPENVDDILKELQFRFGRPEILVRSQISKIQNTPSIKENDLDQLIEFTTQLRNLVAFLKNAKAEEYLINPPLLEELVSKLPLQRKLDWAENLYKLEKIPSIVDFTEWIGRAARIATLVQTSVSPVAIDRTSSKSTMNKKYTLHANEISKTTSQFKCIYCQNDHKIATCPSFIKLTVAQRWNWVKKENACFSCLLKNHRVINCRKRQKCNINNCHHKHHHLLHEDSGTSASSVPTPTKPPPCQPVPVLNLHHSSQPVLFGVVPVKLFGKNIQVDTYAILDSGSSTTMIDASLAKKLNLKGKPDQITVTWFNDETTTTPTEIVEVYTQGVYGNCQKFLIKNVSTINNLSLPCQTVNFNKLKEEYPELSVVPFKSYDDAKPELLIGLDNIHLSRPRDIVDCLPVGPIAMNTPLGWVLYGPQNARIKSSKQNSPMLLVKNVVIEDLSLKSNEDQRARKILEEDTRYRKDHYQCPFLWKKDDIKLPNSIPMTVKRLENLEGKMNRDATYSDLYKNSMSEFLNKGYARKLSVAESQDVSSKTRYLPHFDVVNVNKPDKVRIVFDAATQVENISLNSMLLKGPDLSASLMSVYHKFRERPIAVCGDIKEMFCQIKIVDYNRLKRATAYFLRAIEMFRKKSMITNNAALSASELNEAELYLCRYVQRGAFDQEYYHEPLSKESILYKLSPFVDEKDVIRNQGRIDAASVVPLCTRRPMILPRNLKFTLLIVQYYHKQLLHENTETVICKIRERFRIPNLRVLVKGVKSSYQYCKVYESKPRQLLMGQLPFDRLAAYEPPFTYTGLDYFGPVIVTIGGRHEKRWVALFTCLTYRAVHLEIASDLSTDACLMAIRNFVDRRGKPKRIRSYKGTNFIDDLSNLGMEWYEKVEPLNLSDLVLVCDPNEPRSRWIKGKIVEVIIAKDDQVRSAVILTSRGTLKRPANNLAKLDVVNSSESTGEGMLPNRLQLREVNYTTLRMQNDCLPFCIRDQTGVDAINLCLIKLSFCL